MWADLAFEVATGLLILCGKRFGGWMMFFWNLVKIVVCYSPYLLNAPRLPFTFRERFDVSLARSRSSATSQSWE
jgi:hypothetical protein